MLQIKLKKIAIIGTEKTIESNLYFDIIQSFNKIQIYNVACPLFVPIVEEGLENSSIATSVINMYLKNLKKLDIQGLVLGCLLQFNKIIKVILITQSRFLNLERR